MINQNVQLIFDDKVTSYRKAIYEITSFGEPNISRLSFKSAKRPGVFPSNLIKTSFSPFQIRSVSNPRTKTVYYSVSLLAKQIRQFPFRLSSACRASTKYSLRISAYGSICTITVHCCTEGNENCMDRCVAQL